MKQWALLIDRKLGNMFYQYQLYGFRIIHHQDYSPSDYSAPDI